MIFQVEPKITENDIKAVSSYMGSGGWLTEHKVTEDFETKISKYVSRKYAVSVPNGTIAIYLSLVSLGVKKGDKVAVPNITMIATINAIIWAGATPVLIDVDRDLCMSYSSLIKIKNLKAVIFVPLNGRKGEGESIRKWCKQNKIFLIEDSAHALGTEYGSVKAGNLGDLSVLSFTPHKIITTGQGGMILTNNKKRAEFINDYKSFNRKKGKSDWHSGFGLNFKFTDIQASLGISQFLRLNENIEIKKNIYKTYKENIENNNFFVKEFKNNEVPWFFDIITKNAKTRSALKEYLSKNNIETRFSYPALSMQSYLKNFQSRNLKYSESIHKRVLWLPSSLGLKKEELNFIIEKLNKFKI